ncbi:monovalent cation/H+ antiporter complex subunit F [Fulvivirga ulvae]|uniref:monovalent cation/H+ antiporter complex subunit F n=1 Tax=Fulvivirga ulvae TaxID=2904245 RepID=UPI001F2445D3|nr:monovalent cation/H+ antiporter complex subunit F [Fulvivirga ulvae]UII30590.1 monovalent cation/H+ antiporter complex subunit F [Fulvivirga ulvae]
MIEYAAHIIMVLLAISLLISFIRLLRGPSLPDRVISLDLISSISMGIIITYVFISKKIVYLDVVLIVALIIFLGTVTIAKYLKETSIKDD